MNLRGQFIRRKGAYIRSPATRAVRIGTSTLQEELWQDAVAQNPKQEQAVRIAEAPGKPELDLKAEPATARKLRPEEKRAPAVPKNSDQLS